MASHVLRWFQVMCAHNGSWGRDDTGKVVNNGDSVWVCGVSGTFDIGWANHQGCQYGLSNVRLIWWVVQLCHQDTISQ